MGMPEPVQPVTGFELKRYLGKWYEIARLDHSFEKGLSQVTAEYRLREDGDVLVFNRGFSESENEWKEAEGKAYFVNRILSVILKFHSLVHFMGPMHHTPARGYSILVFACDRKMSVKGFYL
jgi:apolipoprotein D and lipocalin family protein